MHDNNIFVCHNLITLYKSIAFSTNNDFIESQYVYIDYNAKLTKEMTIAFSKSKRIVVAHYPYSNKEKMPFFHWKKYVDSINELIDARYDNSDFYLHIYLDMWAFMPTLIESVKEKYKDNVHIIMHEEGYAMYAKNEYYRASSFFAKSVLYRLFGLSTYGLTTFSHGNHPAIETIYCTNPEKAKLAGKKDNVLILYEGDLFTKEYSESFLSLCDIDAREISDLIDKYDFIFLSQPIYDIIGIQEYESFIRELFDHLYGKKTVIKLHPRDTFDYISFINDDVNILNNQLNIIPFECLYPCIINTRVITFNSSCCANINSTKPCFYMYKLVQNDELTKLCERVKYDPEKVMIVEDFDEMLQ